MFPRVQQHIRPMAVAISEELVPIDVNNFTQEEVQRRHDVYHLCMYASCTLPTEVIPHDQQPITEEALFTNFITWLDWLEVHRSSTFGYSFIDDNNVTQRSGIILMYAYRNPPQSLKDELRVTIDQRVLRMNRSAFYTFAMTQHPRLGSDSAFHGPRYGMDMGDIMRVIFAHLRSRPPSPS